MLYTIKVTDNYIKLGIRKLCRNCPVALAIRDTIPHILADVTLHEIYISNKDDIRMNNALVYHSPTKVVSFVKAFDSGLPVEPFEFELDY